MILKTALAYVLLSFILPAAAQQPSPEATELSRRVERQVRAFAEAPPEAQITIGSRSPSTFNGFDNLPVTIEEHGISRTFQFLVAKDGSKLLYVKEFDLTQNPYKEAMKKIDLSGRPVRGAQDAAVTIVLYDDYECPFCARFYITLFNEVMNHYRDRVRIVPKDFPMSEIHPWALRAAVDANCLAQQNQTAYWQFSDYVHAHQEEFNHQWKAPADGAKPDAPFPALDDLVLEIGRKGGIDSGKLGACIAQQNTASVQASVAEGKSLGINGTPTVFVNGQELEGVLTAEQIRIVIDRALKEASGS